MNTPQVGAGEAPPTAIQRPFQRFDKRRRWNAPIAAALMARTETREVGKAIGACVRRMSAVLELRDDAAVLAYLRGGHFCHARLCPFCEWRRAQAWQARLVRGLEAFAAEHPGHRALFLTLTVRNCPVDKLRETIADMHAGWNRLTKRAEFPTEHWLRRTEITVPSPERTIRPEGGFFHLKGPAADKNQSEDDPTATGPARLADRPPGLVEVHPHIHALLLVPTTYYVRGYLRQTRWQSLWWESMKLDYPPIVDIRNAYSDKISRSKRPPITACVKEAAKYISKAADVVKLGPYVSDLHEQIRGLRMIQASRKLSRWVKNEDPKGEELLDSLQEANPRSCFQQVVAVWNDAAEAYELEG
jgi:plasmid rolling circle replication initiator protein Rep